MFEVLSAKQAKKEGLNWNGVSSVSRDWNTVTYSKQSSKEKLQARVEAMIKENESLKSVRIVFVYEKSEYNTKKAWKLYVDDLTKLFVLKSEWFPKSLIAYKTSIG
jgi:hypothetical protein